MELVSVDTDTVTGARKKITILLDLTRFKDDEDETAEEKAETAGVHKYFEEALIKALDDIQFKLRADNNGIGSFEYWGARGFDRGVDYLEIEDDDTEVTVRVMKGEFTVESAEQLVKDTCLFSRELSEHDLTLKVKFQPKRTESYSETELGFKLETVATED